MNFSTKVSCILAVYMVLNIVHVRTEKILFFHNTASYSHRVPTFTLAEALSRRGHEITFLSPFHPKEPNPNITEIVPKEHEKFMDAAINMEFDVNLRVQGALEPMLNNLFELAYNTCEVVYSSPEVQNFLAANRKFDLVIIDNCFAECGVGLAHKLSAKYIIFSTVTVLAYEYEAFGFQPDASIPEMEMYSPPTPMGFFTRISNAIMSLRWHLAHALYSVKIDHLIRNTLKLPQMPYIGDLISKPSLVFYTGDVITDYPRSLPPNFVNVAGIHCKESTKALPEDISNFIAGTNGTDVDDGFVYISLGSVVVASNLPANIKNVFFETVKSFPNLKFLWKWNGDFPKDIPKNLFLRKWYPQTDVLSHPKIRAFVTQTGRPSILEALFQGVPLISFPVLGDQDFNANRLEGIGASIKLEIGSVTVEELKAAIQKTVYDPSVKARLTKYQKVLRDRPMSPVDTAVWWTEYVLRTEDTQHLRPAGVDQNWFVRRQIDVWGFLSIGLFAIIVGSLVMLTKIARTFLKVQPKLKSA